MLENLLKFRISLASIKSSSLTSTYIICRNLTTAIARDNNGLNENTKKIFNGIVNGERAALGN